MSVRKTSIRATAKLTHSFRLLDWLARARAQSDGECAVYYECQFGAMITDWRKKFNNEDMPFLFVELPSYVENLYQENVDGR